MEMAKCESEFVEDWFGLDLRNSKTALVKSVKAFGAERSLFIKNLFCGIPVCNVVSFITFFTAVCSYLCAFAIVLLLS